MLERLAQRFTPDGRAEAVRNVQGFLWTVADITVHIAISLGVLIVSGPTWAREMWNDIKDRKYRCSKCSTRHAWVLCDTCRHEQQHLEAK